MAETRRKVKQSIQTPDPDAQYKVGDKVKVIKNANPHMKSYVGKHGKVVGGLTRNTCRVKLAYDDEVTFDYREIEPDTKE